MHARSIILARPSAKVGGPMPRQRMFPNGFPVPANFVQPAAPRPTAQVGRQPQPQHGIMPVRTGACPTGPDANAPIVQSLLAAGKITLADLRDAGAYGGMACEMPSSCDPCSGISNWYRRKAGPQQRPLGFPSTTVAPGATANIQTTLDVSFKPECIIIPSTQGANFLVTSIKVRNQEQLSSSGPLHGLMFSELAAFECSSMCMDAAAAGQQITVTVVNLTGNSQQINLAMAGEALDCYSA
jgi:hypothetical protein